MKGRIFKAFGIISQPEDAQTTAPNNAMIEDYVQQRSASKQQLHQNNSNSNSNNTTDDPNDINNCARQQQDHHLGESSTSSPTTFPHHHNQQIPTASNNEKEQQQNQLLIQSPSSSSFDDSGETHTDIIFEDLSTNQTALTSSIIIENNSKMDKLADIANSGYQLLPGEIETHRDTMVYEWNGFNNAKAAWHLGTLVVTNFRIIFTPTNVSTYDDVPVFKGSQVALNCISKAEKIGGKSNRQDHSYLIEIHTKDFRQIRFSFLPTRSTRGKIFKFIREDRVDPHQFFCYRHTVNLSEDMVDGWKVYDPVKEFSRQGCFKTNLNSEKVQWRLTSVNEDYKMCDTYPKYFMVPADITDEEIRAVALFRSKGRIPALSWYDADTGVALTRSSQPLIGLGIRGKKFKDDYRMIEAIIQANARNGDKLMIVDLRPRANAEANRLVKGAGYEKNYKNCDLKFMGIENIHVVRASFTKVMELCMATGGLDPNWFSKVEATSWIEHMRTILSASQYVVSVMEREKVSVLTHCSDGWDRTSQVTCLVQIMLDPYFRTIEGFAVLIEKEWLAFGHMFHKRMGHGLVNSFFSDERGPIFVQFMDCLFQFIRQHPTAFEYNEAFLLHVLDECYAGRYGTFLFDCDRERTLHKVRESTPSLWTRFLNRSHDTTRELERYINPLYDPEQTTYTIYPDLRQSSIHLWSGYWLRYTKEPNGYEYYFPEPSKVIHHRAMDLISDLSQMQQFKASAESKNEATVQTFQREFKVMWEQIEDLTRQNKESKQQYEQDIASFVELCEKQRDELSKWKNTGSDNEPSRHPVKNHGEQVQPEKKQEDMTKQTADEKVNDENIEDLIKDRDAWKKKALDFQLELLNSSNNSNTTISSNDSNGDDKEEIKRLKQYVQHLEATLLNYQRNEQENSTHDQSKIPSPVTSPQPDSTVDRKNSTERWDEVNETWRKNIS